MFFKLRYAHTNSPIESYNNQIKSQFTNRVQLNLILLIEIFRDVPTYEASQDFNYILYVKVTKVITVSAYKLIEKRALSPFENT